MLEIVKETTILGTIISDDLSWNSNSNYLIKKSYLRMPLLYKMAEFGASCEEMKDIYIKFIRSALKYSCVVWGSSLNQENIQNIEHVQKTAVKIILGTKYI